jgi:hypothetical protein
MKNASVQRFSLSLSILGQGSLLRMLQGGFAAGLESDSGAKSRPTAVRVDATLKVRGGAAKCAFEAAEATVSVSGLGYSSSIVVSTVP